MNSNLRNGAIACEWTRARIALVLVAALALFYAILSVKFTLIPTGEGARNASGGVLGNDFLFFYSASKMALAGAPLDVFDQSRLFALQQSISGVSKIQFPWAYPPQLLLLVTPLALIAYFPSLLIWLAATMGPILVLINRMSGAPLLAVLILPPLVQNAISGQNGALTASLVAGGIAALANRRSMLAGLLFGCLAYKPQVFVLAPICLIACRDIRALIGLTVTLIGLPLVSVAFYGIEIWRLFFEHLPEQLSYLTGGRMPINRFATTFIFLFQQTGSEPIARAGQAASTLLAWGLVYWCWRRTSDTFVRVFAFCVAMPLSVPYLFEYDYVLWAMPAAMLAMRIWRGEAGFMSWTPFLILSFLPPWIWISSQLDVNFSAFGVLALVPFVVAEARSINAPDTSGKAAPAA